MVVQFWASPKFKFLHCSNTSYFELLKRVDFLKATLRKRNLSEAFLLQKEKLLLCEKSRCVNDICMKYWRLRNNDLYKAGCRFMGHRQIQVIIKKAYFLGELKRIITLVNLCRTRRWLSKSLFPMNPRPLFGRWHSRSTWKLFLCLNLAGNRGQVDLTLEATHLIRFKHNFRKWKNIDFPEPIYPFVHPEVLVETFEEGHSIAKYVNNEPQSYIKSYLAQLGTSLVLKMLLVDNFFHGDLHPGNIFVRLDGKLPQIILLDVGMIVELSQRNRLILSELFKAAALRDGKTVAKCMLEFSREQRCPDPEQFVRNVDEKFKRYLAVEGSAKNTGECMTDLFNDVRQHRVTIDGDICTVMVSTLVYEGWQRKLDPNLDMLDMFNKQLVRAAQVDPFNCFMMGAIAL